MTYINTLVVVELYQDKREYKGKIHYGNHLKDIICENDTRAIQHAIDTLMKKYPEGHLRTREGRLCSQRGTVKVMQADGTMKVAHLYSDWLFSYDEEEAKQYRQARAEERAEETRRNKLLKQIAEYYKTLTTEELEAFVEMHK